MGPLQAGVSGGGQASLGARLWAALGAGVRRGGLGCFQGRASLAAELHQAHGQARRPGPGQLSSEGHRAELGVGVSTEAPEGCW